MPCKGAIRWSCQRASREAERLTVQSQLFFFFCLGYTVLMTDPCPSSPGASPHISSEFTCTANFQEQAQAGARQRSARSHIDGIGAAACWGRVVTPLSSFTSSAWIYLRGNKHIWNALTEKLQSSDCCWGVASIIRRA